MAETSSHRTITTDLFCYLRYKKYPPNTHNCCFHILFALLETCFFDPWQRQKTQFYCSEQLTRLLFQQRRPLPPQRYLFIDNLLIRKQNMRLVCNSPFDWIRNIRGRRQINRLIASFKRIIAVIKVNIFWQVSILKAIRKQLFRCREFQS